MKNSWWAVGFVGVALFSSQGWAISDVYMYTPEEIEQKREQHRKDVEARRQADEVVAQKHMEITKMLNQFEDDFHIEVVVQDMSVINTPKMCDSAIEKIEEKLDEVVKTIEVIKSSADRFPTEEMRVQLYRTTHLKKITFVDNWNVAGTNPTKFNGFTAKKPGSELTIFLGRRPFGEVYTDTGPDTVADAFRFYQLPTIYSTASRPRVGP